MPEWLLKTKIINTCFSTRILFINKSYPVFAEYVIKNQNAGRNNTQKYSLNAFSKLHSLLSTFSCGIIKKFCILIIRKYLYVGHAQSDGWGQNHQNSKNLFCCDSVHSHHSFAHYFHGKHVQLSDDYPENCGNNHFSQYLILLH